MPELPTESELEAVPEVDEAPEVSEMALEEPTPASDDLPELPTELELEPTSEMDEAPEVDETSESVSEETALLTETKEFVEEIAEEEEEGLSLTEEDDMADPSTMESQVVPSRELESYPELEMSDTPEPIITDDPLIDEDGLEEDDLDSLEISMDDLDADLDVGALLTEPVDSISDDEYSLGAIDDLESTDFDTLLKDLDTDAPSLPDEHAESTEGGLDDALPDLEDMVALEETDPDSVVEDLTPEASIEEDEDFVDVQTLIDESDAAEAPVEPYDQVDIDVGLGDFDNLIDVDSGVDVDTQDGGFSAKMDLARAYLEIEDKGSALEILKDVAENGPEQLKEEAKRLLDKP